MSWIFCGILRNNVSVSIHICILLQLVHLCHNFQDETFEYFLKNNTFEGYDPKRKGHFLPPSRRPKYVMGFWITVIGLPLIYYALKVLLSGSALLMIIVVGISYGGIVASMSRYVCTSDKDEIQARNKRQLRKINIFL